MSLKAVDLDPLLLAGLYTQPIIPRMSGETDDGEDEVQELIPTLGNNKQNILLLIHNPDAPFLPEHLFDLLANILKACRYSLDDVALVNTATQETDWFRLKVQFNPQRVVLFGHPLPELSSGRKPNEAWNDDNCNFLLADPLDAIDKNVSLKTLFWKALQSFFQLRK